jgi:small subunit ribosomal protein S2
MANEETEKNEVQEENMNEKGLEAEAQKESDDSSKEAKSVEDKRSEIIQKSSVEIAERKKALLEKAAKLKEKLTEETPKSEDLKEQVKAKKRTDMLIPLDDYVKAGIYLGTKVVTPDMKQYVYRRRADGLAIFNTDIIDEKLKEGIEYLSKFNPEDVILVCKRQAGWKAAEKFSELTGVRAFTKKYPAGILTNTDLPDFFENELTIVTDHWIDKNALNDTLRVNKKVLMVCDTNNFSKGANQIIIGNNKSQKSLGVIFYLLARGYMKARGEDTSKVPDLEWWTGEIDEKDKGASKGV